MNNNTLKHIQSQYSSKTTATSTLCRTIVFGMIGAIWVFFQEKGVFKFTTISSIAFGLFAIYLVLDIIQYFSTSFLYGISFFYEKKIGNKLDRFIDYIDAISFILFTVKIFYLFVIMSIVVAYVFHNICNK